MQVGQEREEECLREEGRGKSGDGGTDVTMVISCRKGARAKGEAQNT